MTDIYKKYLNVRRYTEDLCSPLGIEDYVPQPVYYVSPPKWQLGHTSWFFEEFILGDHLTGYKLFHPRYSYLFNSYYNAVGERIVRDSRGAMSRPTVEEIYKYRKHVDEGMKSLLEGDKITPQLEGLIELGLQHEQQHQELLLTDIKYILGHNPLYPVYDVDEQEPPVINAESGFLTIPGGLYEIGFQDSGFFFDNEMNPHKVYLDDFELNKALVTNGDFLEFIEDKGYEKFELWLDEGWTWLKETGIQSPMYWVRKGEGWYYYSLQGLQELNKDEILSHISFFEAMAYAEWKNMRLPTEFEWEVAADQLDWGKRWEWTNSAYLPYPGYQKEEGAVGEYNGKFMVNQMVLRGASVATSPGHSRKTYRNFFHPQVQWQFSGIRLAKK